MVRIAAESSSHKGQLINKLIINEFASLVVDFYKFFQVGKIDGLHFGELNGHSIRFAASDNTFGLYWKVLRVEWNLELKV